MMAVPILYPGKARRMLITIPSMVASTMVAVDITIATIALPHMQSGLSASLEQVLWAPTSYLVAGAIATPLGGWLSDTLSWRGVFFIHVPFGLLSCLGMLAFLARRHNRDVPASTCSASSPYRSPSPRCNSSSAGASISTGGNRPKTAAMRWCKGCGRIIRWSRIPGPISISARSARWPVSIYYLVFLLTQIPPVLLLRVDKVRGGDATFPVGE
ncbi:MAG: hypothetical protein P8Y48_08930 [Novosphingobium sp.]